MTTTGHEPEANPFGWPAWLWSSAMALVALLFAICALHQVTVLAKHAGLIHDGGPPGVETKAIWGSGLVEVVSVTPGGAVAAAGLKPGDRFRAAPFESQLIHPPGSRVPITAFRGGRSFETTVIVPPSDDGSAGHLLSLKARQANLLLGLVAAGGLVSMLFGTVLIVRGWRSRAAVMLGVMLIGLGGQNPLDPTWGPTIEAARVLFVLRLPAFLVETWLWPLLCIELAGGAMTRRQRQAVNYAAVALALIQGLVSLSYWGLPAVQAIPGLPLVAASTLSAQVLGLAVIVSQYRKNDAAARNRIKIVVTAFLFYAIGLQFEIGVGVVGESGLVAITVTGFILMTALAAGLLAYSVLRQRLFDIGFAINRTLVYGAVSFTLLAAFGLAEWGADRLVPEEWHRQSALYSAGIALLLFLSFHRLRDWFERHVERLFFASWQRAEADLKRFVASGSHFRQAAALCREFCAEVERFAQGAPAALYLREDSGAFAVQAGSLPGGSPRYAEEDRAFALLAAERAPVDLAEARSALPAATAFPMFDQLGLAGFVLLGPRPDGAHYRPDEIANLAWATQQVGFDLQALQARDLRAEIAALREQLPPRPLRRRKPRLAAA